MKILFATDNRDKLDEVRWILHDTGWQLISLSDINYNGDIPEVGQTYYDNAVIKARTAFSIYKSWTMAEDSGLEIDALGGKPGVLSARFFPPDVTCFERNRRILELIIDVPTEKRTACFRSVVCLIDPTGAERCFEGVCQGRIAHTIRGGYGFGYDPIFIPEGYGLTFAEMGQEIKNRISHRALAIRQMMQFLKEYSAHYK